MEDPPVSWTRDQIDGYVVWSFTVWNKIKGINAMLDSWLDDIFRADGLVGLSQAKLDQKLNQYYAILLGHIPMGHIPMGHIPRLMID